MVAKHTAWTRTIRAGAAVLSIAAAVAGATPLYAGPAVAAARPTPTPMPGPAPIRIDWRRELMMTDLSVVNDPLRTTYPVVVNPAVVRLHRSTGKWTFGRLMTDMAGRLDPALFTEEWLALWEQDQLVNGFIAPARPSIRSLVIEPWRRRSGGRRLDLTKAPFRLLAIVNRLDLRQNPTYGGGNAGEGRFVFGALDELGNSLPFTVIFEYKLPARSLADVKRWATAWHALGAIPFGAGYNQALEVLTDRFAGRNADPTRPNGSSIGQIRTNEIALDSPWELREFVLDPRSGRLVQTTTKQSPDMGFNNTQELADWINANEADLIAQRHQIPATWLAAADPAQFVWNAPGVNPDARHGLALTTCSGCHLAETSTPFTHVGTRVANQEAPLSGFLTGTTITDPISGQLRTFNDIERRTADLRRLLTMRIFDLAVEPARNATH